MTEDDLQMSDAVEFLKARLSEVEELANDSSPAPWTADGYGRVQNGEGAISWCTGQLFRDSTDELIAEFDPAMVLRLAAATRAVLDEHSPITAISDFPQPTPSVQRCSRCCDIDGDGHDWEPLPWPCPTLRSVAAGWGWVDE